MILEPAERQKRLRLSPKPFDNYRIPAYPVETTKIKERVISFRTPITNFVFRKVYEGLGAYPAYRL